MFRDVAGRVWLHVFDDQKDKNGNDADGQQLDPEWQDPSGRCRWTGRNNRSRETGLAKHVEDYDNTLLPYKLKEICTAV